MTLLALERDASFRFSFFFFVLDENWVFSALSERLAAKNTF